MTRCSKSQLLRRRCSFAKAVAEKYSPRAIFLSFPRKLILPYFLRSLLDRWESERIVLFTGGVTNGS